MQLYNHLTLEHANKIIILANNKMNKNEFHKETGISRGKIGRCLPIVEITTIKPIINHQWKGPRRIIKKP